MSSFSFLNFCRSFYRLRIFLLLLMIKSYLGYIEIIEMISRRLTKTQKIEILEAYRAGDNTNDLAEKYTCLLYTSPSPRDKRQSRMPSSA